MDSLISVTLCDDGSCCCLPPRSTVALISIMSLLASLIDMVSSEADADAGGRCPMKDYVESMREVLLALFQLANILLLVASIIENAVLVNIYVCYTLGFVVLALTVSLLELLYHAVHEGAGGMLTFVPEVSFIFVISRCLPLVNTYKTHLDHLAATLAEHVQSNETCNPIALK